MLNWLAVWLQQIIAVVLLAGFIDLLLPNKSMQRYVRLVAGLIVLLTILTPIIRVLQGDFSAKLDAEVEHWFNADPAKELHMPTLQDIQENAAVLKKQEAASASALAEKQIEDAMTAGIEQATGLRAAAVKVRMKAAGKGQPAQIGSVSVTLARAEPPKSEPEEEGSAAASGGGDNAAVDEVQTVQVNVDPLPAEPSPNSGESQVKPVSGTIAEAVKSVLREGWSVNPALVEVLELVPDGASAR